MTKQLFDIGQQPQRSWRLRTARKIAKADAELAQRTTRSLRCAESTATAAEAREREAEERVKVAETRCKQLMLQDAQNGQRIAKLESEKDEMHVALAKFVKHLEDHDVQVPDTHGRLWKDGMWQAKEWGKSCSKCKLNGHWMQQCPVP